MRALPDRLQARGLCGVQLEGGVIRSVYNSGERRCELVMVGADGVTKPEIENHGQRDRRRLHAVCASSEHGTWHT